MTTSPSAAATGTSPASTRLVRNPLAPADPAGKHGTIYVVERIHPYARHRDEVIGAFTDLERACDRRRTKMHENTDWWQRPDGAWTTVSHDYVKQTYPHYRVRAVAFN